MANGHPVKLLGNVNGSGLSWLTNLLHRLLGLPHVQINKDIPRLGTLARTDNSTILKFIHDAGGTTVAQPQSALKERHARLLLAADDLDALLNDLLVLINAALIAKTTCRL